VTARSREVLAAIATSFRAAAPEEEPSSHSLQRRRVVVLAGLVIGTILLALSFALAHSNGVFYALTLALAANWIVAGVLSGPIRLRPVRGGHGAARSVAGAVLIAAATIAIFVGGALLVRQIAPLREHVSNVLAHAHHGSIVLIVVVTVANALAEEVFFRGALYSATNGRFPVIVSTLFYAGATAATGNPILVFAAVTLGIVLALQRRATGAIVAPIITHVLWSLALLFTLAPLFPTSH
jgi:membrane protease YdiL (CAAX protease family)